MRRGGDVQVAPCVPSVWARLLRALTAQQVEYGASVEDLYALFLQQGLPSAADGDALPLDAVAAMAKHLVPEATDGEVAAAAALADLGGSGAVTLDDLLDTISTARAVRATLTCHSRPTDGASHACR